MAYDSLFKWSCEDGESEPYAHVKLCNSFLSDIPNMVCPNVLLTFAFLMEIDPRELTLLHVG